MKYFAVFGASILAPYVFFLLLEDTLEAIPLYIGCIATFALILLSTSHLAFPKKRQENTISKKHALAYLLECRVQGKIPIMPKGVNIDEEDHGAVSIKATVATNGYVFTGEEKHGDTSRLKNPPMFIASIPATTPLEVIEALQEDCFLLPSTFKDGQNARYALWPLPEESPKNSILIYKFISFVVGLLLATTLSAQHIGPTGLSTGYLTFSTYAEEKIEIHPTYACVGDQMVSISEAMEVLAEGSLGRISRGARLVSLGDHFPYEEDYQWALTINNFTVHIETFLLRGIIFNVIFINNVPEGLISDKGLKSLQGIWDIKYLRI